MMKAISRLELRFLRGDGGSTKSSQSIEQMMKDTLADESFLKEIKSNSLVRTLVINWLQDISKKTEPVENEQTCANLISKSQSRSPKLVNVSNHFNVSKLKVPNKKLEYFTAEVKDGEIYGQMLVLEVKKEIEILE